MGIRGNGTQMTMEGHSTLQSSVVVTNRLKEIQEVITNALAGFALNNLLLLQRLLVLQRLLAAMLQCVSKSCGCVSVRDRPSLHGL